MKTTALKKWGGWTVVGLLVTGVAIAATTEFVDDVVISTSKTNVPVLSATGQGGVVFGGVLNTGTTPATGAGVRLMWVPRRAAFRVGHVTDTQWDMVSIGRYSVAMGYNGIASGESSLAIGDTATASGTGAMAIGNDLNATGDWCLAGGRLSSASGNYSLAFGYSSTATMAFSTALGRSVTSGTYASALGNSTAERDYDIAGGNSTARGPYATALGRATAEGTYSIAVSRSIATGNYAAALGYTENSSYCALSIGRHNLVEGSVTDWVPTDPAFVIGNGASTTERSNAFVIRKNGDMEVTGKVTMPRQGDILMGEFGNPE